MEVIVVIVVVFYVMIGGVLFNVVFIVLWNCFVIVYEYWVEV